MKHIGDKQLQTCIQADYDWTNVSFYLVMLGDVIVAIGVVVTSIGENSIAKMEAIMDARLGGMLTVEWGVDGSCHACLHAGQWQVRLVETKVSAINFA